MPLIVLSGFPSCGKSRLVRELKAHFENDNKTVHIVSENEQVKKSGVPKNVIYSESNKEKTIRDQLKSEVTRLISPTNLVILDGLNYIKGYRYELYCSSKANHSTQCTIHIVINKDDAWAFNESREEDCEKYERVTFDALMMRYEDPDGKNRWDSPLFYVYKDSVPDFTAISDCLFLKKAPPPNLATQNAPLNSTNFLFELNKITKEITNTIISLITTKSYGDVPIPGYDELTINVRHATVPQIIGLSRQYLTYSKMHTPDIEKVPHLYIQYLKANLN